MRYYRAIIAVIVLFAVSAVVSPAQTTTADVGFTPYSVFGLGDLARPGTAYNKSMGGIGIGDRNERYVNILNPAAVTARQDKSFMMDFGLEMNNVMYAATDSESGDMLHSADNTFNMNHIVLSFPIGKKAAFKGGIMPFSNTGYSFSHLEDNDGIISQLGEIQYSQLGQGGISQAFLGAGVTLFKRLSLGVDGQYYFGSVSKYTSATFASASSYRSINSGWTYTLRGLGVKFGLQYEQPLNENNSMVLGATYRPGVVLDGTVNRFAYGIMSSTDTIINSKQPVDGYTVPAEIGAGVSFRHGDKWSAGFDYTRQDWTGASIGENPGTGFVASLQESYKAGFEFTPNRYDSRYYYKHITYRGGCYYEKSLYSVNGYQVGREGITFGVSLPVYRYFNSLNFGVDIGQRGSVTNGLVRERYILFTASFALHDIWFLKPMYE